MLEESSFGATNTRETVREPVATQVSVPDQLALLLANERGVRAVPLPLSGALTVGRGSGADLRINDHAVSRVHLRIEASKVVKIIDLGSANGTFVRGERMAAGEARVLAIGESIEIGRTLIVVRRMEGAHGGELARAPQEPELGDAMRAILARADRVAASDIPVLILGETGVGKDVLAERIHKVSPRANAHFLRLNCAAFSATLLESELFGHIKGAFTGATSAKQGLLQSAEGGSVLLDEIGELPLELQAKLLLVVERREMFAVGSERPRAIDVRFLAATHRDLRARVKQGLFREDLYHRLNGVPIGIPPLRERRSEIVGLAQRFAASAARALGRPVPALDRAALDVLLRYSWPGNIRELRSTMERAVVLGEGDTLLAKDLLVCLESGEESPASEAELGSAFPSERERIVAALGACAGNQSRASKLLGMSRNTFIARLNKYGVARPLTQRECE